MPVNVADTDEDRDEPPMTENERRVFDYVQAHQTDPVYQTRVAEALDMSGVTVAKYVHGLIRSSKVFPRRVGQTTLLFTNRELAKDPLGRGRK